MVKKNERWKVATLSHVRQPMTAGVIRRSAVLLAALAVTAVVLVPTPSYATVEQQQWYVERVYGDFLLREPTESEVSTLSAQLESGTLTRNGLVTNVLASGEFRSVWTLGVVYQYLDRYPTPDESLWLDTLLAASSNFLQTEQQVLAGSPYFTAKGGTSQLYVAGLYTDVLWRQGSPSEISYWANRIQNGTSTRSSVATTILRSDESARKRVQGANPASCAATDIGVPDSVQSGSYCLVLDRPADPSGYSFWWPRLTGSDQLPDLWRELAISSEYFNGAQP